MKGFGLWALGCGRSGADLGAVGGCEARKAGIAGREAQNPAVGGG